MARQVGIGYLSVDMSSTSSPPLPGDAPELGGPSVAAPGRFALLRALRPHQWAKNLLVLVPVLAAHQRPGLQVAIAFVSFSLLASSVYLTNDVADIEHDRLHPRKKDRPVASGQLSRGTALFTALLLLVASLLLALLLPRTFVLVWLTYFVATSAYSMGLKRRVMLDVIILAGLYTARVVAGAAAVGVPLSSWFLAFSVFVFTSLALLKRAVEALEARDRERDAIRGRGWRVEDLPVLGAMGAACAVAAALVYCLYITGSDVRKLYARPELLWIGLPVLLYWLGRVWLMALRGEVHDDPVVFALKDPTSWAVLAVMVFSVWMAT